MVRNGDENQLQQGFELTVSGELAPACWMRLSNVATDSTNARLQEVQVQFFIHSFIVKSTQQTCIRRITRAVENKHLHMNKNNKNTEANFKTQNTLAMPKTRTVIIRI